MAILTTSGNSVRAGSDTKKTDPNITIDSGWQSQMKTAIRDLEALCEFLKLPAECRKDIAATSQFGVFAPPAFLSRIEKGNPDDPLLRQILPVESEDLAVHGFVENPLQESPGGLAPGLLQKYSGRALMITTGVCAVHCRYCFRRNFPYSAAPKSLADWEPALEQIENDPSLSEILLSGGDPLTLVDSKLQELFQRLEKIEHVKRIRIHTRLPIMIPQRVTNPLTEMLANSRLKTVFVVHVNHAHEIDDSVQKVLAQIRAAGCLLLNQSVLLRGVNDSVKALEDLSLRLLECDVVPYYLHQLDKVTGASHFEVSIEEGRSLIAQLRALLPGYAVPRYVQEIPGQPNKTILA